MKRRDARRVQVEPPARLRAFDRRDWSDVTGDDRRAWQLWLEERRQWCQAHGWPGGLNVVDLLREAVAMKRGHGRRG